MEKICLFVTVILLPLFCHAQEQPAKEITPVVVESNRKFFADDNSAISINPQTDFTSPHENIGYVLLKKSPLVIRNYGGQGSLTSVSMHGTGSNHTQVTWNGIPLNSPTTGQADLSLLPAGMVQQVEIINGASGSLFGSGTFGGSINLFTEPDWENRLTTRYSFQAGTYGHMTHLANLQFGRKWIQYHVSFITSRAENNFSFKDVYTSGKPLRTNYNNHYADAGIMQNFYVNAGKGNFIEAGAWYQRKILQIPSIMGMTENSKARQKDSLFRSFISYRKKTDRSVLQIRSAYFTDYLNYTNGIHRDSPAYISSTIETRKYLNEAEYRLFITDRLIAGAGLSHTIIKGESENYGGRISEAETAVYGSLKFVTGKFIVNSGIRKEFYQGFNPLPQVSAGIRYMPSIDLIFRATLSTKFRKPSLNEKFWQPGGNPNLNPEKGIGGDLSAEWNIINESGSLISARLNLYYQSVDNWIQWIIKDSITPVEYKKVHAAGTETWIDFTFRVHPFRVSGFINYNYNRSVISKTYDSNPHFEGKQLIYVPLHSAKGSVDVLFKQLMAEVSGSYTGRRETAESGDRQMELPSYTVWDLSFGYMRSFGAIPVKLGIRCDNVFNTSYEIIRSYPVPGRTFRFVITLGYERKTEK